jgi:hypothetical protein
MLFWEYTSEHGVVLQRMISRRRMIGDGHVIYLEILSNFTAYVIFSTPPEEYEGLIH